MPSDTVNIAEELYERDCEEYRCASQQLKGLDEQRAAIVRKLQAISRRWPGRFKEREGRSEGHPGGLGRQETSSRL